MPSPSLFRSWEVISRKKTKGHSTKPLYGIKCQRVRGLAEKINAYNHVCRHLIIGLKEEVSRLQSVLGLLQEGVLLLSQDRRVLYFNRASSQLVSGDGSQLMGSPIDLHIPSSAFSEFVDSIFSAQSSIESEMSWAVESEERRFKVYGQYFRTDAERYSHILLVISDVTKIWQVERIRRDFVSNVSHELKTPLTSIQGSVETLLDGALSSPEDSERFVGMIGRQALRLSQIVEELLQLSRMQSESEVRSLKKQTHSLLKMLEQAKETCWQVSREYKVAVEVEVAKSHWQGYFHLNLIHQALVNLIDNAIKASPPGSTVRVIGRNTPKATEFLIVDSGKGISEEHLERIFERFYRVDPGRYLGGSGIGLALVKHIIHAHDGEIEVESEVGQGSRFWISLPRGASSFSKAA